MSETRVDLLGRHPGGQVLSDNAQHGPRVLGLHLAGGKPGAQGREIGGGQPPGLVEQARVGASG